MHNTLKIMTFNIWTSVGIDGINEFPFRAPKIKRLIDEKDPDIICFQEIVPKSREWII